MTFVDEFTRKIWLYLLEEKSGVFSSFVKFCALIERQNGFDLKSLITSRGGEYNSKEFHEFCVSKGIKHEVIAPYTPQHNGLAEKRNRILLDMGKCMLKGKTKPHCY